MHILPVSICIYSLLIVKAYKPKTHIMINVSKVLSYLALVVILQFVASQGCLAYKIVNLFSIPKVDMR